MGSKVRLCGMTLFNTLNNRDTRELPKLPCWRGTVSLATWTASTYFSPDSDSSSSAPSSADPVGQEQSGLVMHCAHNEFLNSEQFYPHFSCIQPPGAPTCYQISSSIDAGDCWCQTTRLLTATRLALPNTRNYSATLLSRYQLLFLRHPQDSPASASRSGQGAVLVSSQGSDAGWWSPCNSPQQDLSILTGLKTCKRPCQIQATVPVTSTIDKPFLKFLGWSKVAKFSYDAMTNCAIVLWHPQPHLLNDLKHWSPGPCRLLVCF